MKEGAFKADSLLLFTALIWGFTFVAQRVGMDHVGPFTFNGIRFALGSLSLLPLLYLLGKKRNTPPSLFPGKDPWILAKGGALAGVALFLGASLQQVGMVHTTAGNAGFITGLYVIMVPIFGLAWRQRPGTGTWIGATLAGAGLFLLSVTEQFTIGFGDLLVLLGAFFWAGHVLLIAWLSPRTEALKLSALQFAVCSILSLLVAFFTEEIPMVGILRAAVPILYGGFFSVGLAYTLQVVAQRDAPPAHTAVILSLEGVFAALGGWLLLDEVLSFRALLGCALMLTGMLLSELSAHLFSPKTARSPLPDTASEG